MPNHLLRQIGDWLSCTKILINQKKYKTNKGVPQGAINSPILFNLYINDFIQMIQQTGNKILAYADDIVIMVKGSVEDLNSILL